MYFQTAINLHVAKLDELTLARRDMITDLGHRNVESNPIKDVSEQIRKTVTAILEIKNQLHEASRMQTCALLHESSAK